MDLQELYEKTKGKYRTIVKRVLDKIFQKAHPHKLSDISEVSIRSLLTWDMWPMSIKIYSKLYTMGFPFGRPLGDSES
jgi:hypothetical protein